MAQEPGKNEVSADFIVSLPCVRSDQAIAPLRASYTMKHKVPIKCELRVIQYSHEPRERLIAGLPRATRRPCCAPPRKSCRSMSPSESLGSMRRAAPNFCRLERAGLAPKDRPRPVCAGSFGPWPAANRWSRILGCLFQRCLDNAYIGGWTAAQSLELTEQLFNETLVSRHAALRKSA